MNKSIPFVPNAITAFGLICGLFVIFKVNMVDPGEGTYNGQLILAGLLLVSAAADVLDGAVARAMKAESLFGEVFDSLADAVSFGVAPSVIVLKSLSVEPGTELSMLVTLGAILYSVCGVLRLVRFNVSSSQEESDKKTLLKRPAFIGLPIPGGAAAVVSANLFMLSPRFEEYVPLSCEARAIIMALLMALIGYLMVCHLRYPSVKSLQVKVAHFGWIFGLTVVGVLIFWGILYHFALLFVAVTWSYVLSGMFFTLWRKMRKNGTV